MLLKERSGPATAGFECQAIFAAGIAHHLTLVVENHRSAFIAGIGRPIRRPVASKRSPGAAHFIGQSVLCGTLAGEPLPTVGTIEHKRNLDGVGRTQTSAENGCSPGKVIHVSGCSALSRLALGLPNG